MQSITTEQALELLRSDLSETYCDVTQVFDDVEVLDGTTESITTQAIVRIKDNESNKILLDYVQKRIRQGQVPNVFLKLIPDTDQTYNRDNVEIAIYNYLTKYLVEAKVTPNIMNYVASGYCTDLSKHLGWLSDDHIRQWFSRDSKLRRANVKDMVNHLRSARILLTEKGEGMSLADLIEDLYFDSKYFDAVVFQIGYTLNQMHNVGVRHNDLHLGNIWINIHHRPVSMVYRIGDVLYHIKSKYIVKIYDFDLATFTIPIPDFLKNDKLNLDICERHGCCSNPDPLYDWYTFCYFMDLLDSYMREHFHGASPKAILNAIKVLKKTKNFSNIVKLDSEIFENRYWVFNGRYCDKYVFNERLAQANLPQGFRCRRDAPVPKDKLKSFDDLLSEGYFDRFKINPNVHIPYHIPIYTSL